MRLIFEQKLRESKDIFTFIFEPFEPIAWIAGQSIRLELQAGWGSEERRFTISSAPYERKIAITTRLSGSAFKQALAALQPGDEIEAYAVQGKFVWEENTYPHVLVAGGIGSTPFHAMLKQRIHDNVPLAATLLYASNDDTLLFGSEFTDWQRQHPELTFHFLANQLLLPELVWQHISDEHQSLVYLSGPQAMVDKVSRTLFDEYQFPEERLKRDWFTGRLD